MSEDRSGSVYDWVFLAMAHSRLQDFEKARFWLEKTLTAPEPTAWQQRIELRLLREEAETVVNVGGVGLRPAE